MTHDAEVESRYMRCDVTDRAMAYMMEPGRLAEEIYVSDIFSLPDRNPMLVEMFSRSRAGSYQRGE